MNLFRKQRLTDTENKLVVTSLMAQVVKKTCVPCKKPEFDSWVGKMPWRRKWQPIPVFWLGESHGQRNMVGYSPRGCKELERTEQLTLSLSRGKQWGWVGRNHMHTTIY